MSIQQLNEICTFIENISNCDAIGDEGIKDALTEILNVTPWGSVGIQYPRSTSLIKKALKQKIAISESKTRVNNSGKPRTSKETDKPKTKERPRSQEKAASD